MSVVDLANAARVSKNTITKAESLETWGGDLRPSSIQAILTALRVSPEFFLKDDHSEQLPGVPLYNGVPASPPSFVGGEEQGVGTIPRTIPAFVGITNPRIYAVVVRGDSMSPTFHSGDIAVLDPDAAHVRGVESGRIYACWFSSTHDEGATLKRVYVRPGGKWLLKADNTKIESLEVNPDDITKMDLVVGKIVPFGNHAVI